MEDKIIKVTEDLWQTVDISEWAVAMAKFHSQMESIKKDKSLKMFNNSPAREYLSLDAIIEATRPVLAKNNLFVVQSVSGDSVVTTIYHTSGQFQASALKFSAMDGKGTNSLQNMGGGLTYIKRYALSAALYIAADEDKDGNNENVTIKPEKTKPTPKTYTLANFKSKKTSLANLFVDGKTLEEVSEMIKTKFDTIAPDALQSLQDLRDEILQPVGS